MNFKWLKFAFQNTLRNRRRSLVTVAVAALGTAGILLAGGFALYTYESLAQSAARESGHLVLAKPEHFTREEETPLQNGLTQAEALQQQLLGVEQVRTVLPRIEFSGLISNGEKSIVMVGLGVEPDAEFAIKGPFLNILAGEVLSSNASEAEVMLGEALARNIHAQPGSSLTLLAGTSDGALNAVDVRVKSVFSTGVPDLDKRLLYADLATTQRLLASQKISSLGVFLNRMDQTLPVQEQLRNMHPELTVQTWQDQAFYYRSVRDLYNRIFGALGLIIGVIVVFVVTNTMLMTIIERTREIGTLRAMGTLPGQVLTTLSLEGMVLGGVGALLGSILALALSIVLFLVPVEMPPPPGSSVGYALNITIDPRMYLATIACMVLLTMATSAWVASKSVNMPVVDALAHT